MSLHSSHSPLCRLFVQIKVTLSREKSDLLVGVEHEEPVKMSLSCAVEGDSQVSNSALDTNTHIIASYSDIFTVVVILRSFNVQDGERLASSVADDLQVWFESLTLKDIVLDSTIPSVLVSDHDDVTNDHDDVANSDQKEDEPERVSDSPATNQTQLSLTPDSLASPEVTSSDPPQGEGHSVAMTTSDCDKKPDECEPLPAEEEDKVHLKQEQMNEEPGLVNGGHLQREKVCCQLLYVPRPL